MSQQIPDKRYFKIGEVSKIADVAPHVLRYWESEFKGIKPKRANSKQRLYRREDVELILVIKKLLHNKRYTISGARKIVESGEPLGDYVVESSQATASTDSNETVEKLGSIKEELLELQKLMSKKR